MLHCFKYINLILEFIYVYTVFKCVLNILKLNLMNIFFITEKAFVINE